MRMDIFSISDENSTWRLSCRQERPTPAWEWRKTQQTCEEIALQNSPVKRLAKKARGPKNVFYLRALLSASTPPATRIPSSSSSLSCCKFYPRCQFYPCCNFIPHASFILVASFSFLFICITWPQTSFWKHIYVSFQRMISLKFLDRYSVGIKRERKWNRKCKIKGGVCLINTIVLTCAVASALNMTLKGRWKLEAGYKFLKVASNAFTPEEVSERSFAFMHCTLSFRNV